MNAIVGWVVAAVVALGAGYYIWFMPKTAVAPLVTGTQQTQTQGDTQTFGTYKYECDEHVAFALTVAADGNSLQIAATGGGMYPPASTLTKQAATSGVRFTGNNIVLTGKGETVTLGEGASAINCSPVADPNNAPMNWGD